MGPEIVTEMYMSPCMSCSPYNSPAVASYLCTTMKLLSNVTYLRRRGVLLREPPRCITKRLVLISVPDQLRRQNNESITVCCGISRCTVQLKMPTILHRSCLSNRRLSTDMKPNWAIIILRRLNMSLMRLNDLGAALIFPSRNRAWLLSRKWWWPYIINIKRRNMPSTVRRWPPQQRKIHQIAMRETWTTERKDVPPSATMPALCTGCYNDWTIIFAYAPQRLVFPDVHSLACWAAFYENCWRT